VLKELISGGHMPRGSIESSASLAFHDGFVVRED
jgi:hypothetical protein